MGNLDEQWSKRIADECSSGDNEDDHFQADAILLELLKSLGYEKTVEAYHAVEKWYA